MRAVPLFLAAAAGSLAPGSARADEAGTVSLHVASPFVVEVEHRDQPDKPWAAVCTNPCDLEVPIVGQYRVRGRGVTSSAPFSLRPQGRSAVLQVSPGSKNKERTGWFVIGGGVAAVLVGAALDAVGATQSTVAGQGGQGDPGTNTNSRVNFYLAGTTLIIAGLAAAIYGGSFVYDNARSTVRENDAPPAPPAPEGSRDGILQQALAATDTGGALVVPVLTATF
jgi:hypothetical protein